MGELIEETLSREIEKEREGGRERIKRENERSFNRYIVYFTKWVHVCARRSCGKSYTHRTGVLYLQLSSAHHVVDRKAWCSCTLHSNPTRPTSVIVSPLYDRSRTWTVYRHVSIYIGMTIHTCMLPQQIQNCLLLLLWDADFYHQELLLTLKLSNRLPYYPCQNCRKDTAFDLVSNIQLNHCELSMEHENMRKFVRS